MGPQLYKFSDRCEDPKNALAKLDIADFEQPQGKFPLVALSQNVTNSEQEGSISCIVTPFDDYNLTLRISYFLLCSGRRAMQQNLLKISVMLKQIPHGLSFFQTAKLRFPVLAEVSAVQHLYGQLVKKWRSMEECSVLLLAHRFPIADQILTCALRVVLVGQGASRKLMDLSCPVDHSTVMQALDVSLPVNRELVIPRHEVSCVKMTVDKAELPILSEIVSSKSEPTTMQRTLHTHNPTLELSGMHPQSQQPPPSFLGRQKPKLKPLHSVIFYSMLLQ